MKSLTRPPAAGFSILELMVVVVLFGIMASIAAPSLGGMLDRNHVNRAADRVAGDISYARMLAVREARETGVLFGSGEYRVVRFALDGAEETVKVVRVELDFAGTEVQGPAEIRFNTRGMRLFDSDDDLAVVLSRGSQSHEIKVSGVGQVYRAN
jgi:type II secretion system protein H